MIQRKTPDDEDLVDKYAKRIFRRNEKTKFLALAERLNLIEDITELIQHLRGAKQNGNPQIAEHVGQILLHSRIPEGNVEGQAISSKESQMLWAFGLKLCQDLIRDHYQKQTDIVGVIEAETIGFCALHNLDSADFKPIIENLREYELKLRNRNSGEAAILPPLPTSNETKPEPYLSWRVGLSKLELLAKILQADCGWIKKQKEWVEFLHPEKTRTVPVVCTSGMENHLALLLHCLVKGKWVQPKISKGHWMIAGQCLINSKGMVIHRNLKEIPWNLKKQKRNNRQIISDVHEVLRQIGFENDVILDFKPND